MVIVFLIIYGFTSIGATVHLHYCMKEFVGASLWHSDNNKCGKCGMQTKKAAGCCEDEHKQIKIDSEHQKVFPQSLFSPLFTPSLRSFFSDHPFVKYVGSKNLLFINGSPPKLAIAAFILHCNFRI